ncbi:DUF1990 family protein [Brevibacterium sp. 1718]|uniref:DUF1990 family protein n=1 Tax=Brevibacterium sp. 1718 TaxID=3413510 RepID=UPI003DA8B0B3
MNHLEFHLDLGSGDQFPLAREAIFSWTLQELAGVVVRPSRRVSEGQIVDLGLNPAWPAPPRRPRGRDLLVPVGSCVVTRVFDEKDRAGFTYRTLPGHLESGEETFLVSIGADGRLGVTISADSVPAHPLLRLGAPVTVAAQELMARRYVEGLKRQLRTAERSRRSRALATASALIGRELSYKETLAGGQHALTMAARDGNAELVVRAFPAGHDAAIREAEVLDRLSPLGDLVPRLIAHNADTNDPVIVTTRVPGSPPDPATPLTTIAREMAAALIRIHELDDTGLPPTPQSPPSGDSAIAIRAQREWANLDRDEEVLTHTDFWAGNALWTGGRLTGVVDWSGASRGPRGVDLAWCRQDLVLLGSPEAAADFLDEYERLLGRRIHDIRAWDVQAAARAQDRVETWLPNYHGIGLTDMTAEDLRHRLDTWNEQL